MTLETQILRPRQTGGEPHLEDNPGRPLVSDVTVAVLNYNGGPAVEACMKSVFRLKAPPGEVILIDDGSTDGSPEHVRSLFPHIRIVSMGANTKRLNRVRNRALGEARLPYLLLVDNDVTLREDCLESLLKAIRTLPGAAVCIPRTLYADDPTRIYQDGQILHYVGATQAIHRNSALAEADEKARMTIGWGVQLIDKRQAAEVGNFNEDYMMGWGDDGEFNHRLNLAGRTCYHVPSAIVYHKRLTGARRYYGTIRNRWHFILECYHIRTLLLCSPAFFVYEVALFLFVCSKGAVGQYLRAMGSVVMDLSSILRVRRRIQATRQRPDSALMTSGSVFIAPEYLNSRLLKWGLTTLNTALNGYWVLVRRAL